MSRLSFWRLTAPSCHSHSLCWKEWYNDIFSKKSFKKVLKIMRMSKQWQKAAIQQWNAVDLCLVFCLTGCHAVSLNDASPLSLLHLSDLIFILFSSLVAVHSTYSPQGPSTPKTSTEKTACIFPILYSASHQKSLPFLPFPFLSSPWSVSSWLSHLDSHFGRKREVQFYSVC